MNTAPEFDFNGLIDAARELIRFDEVERALVVLNQVPALHRDYPIPEVEELKTQIQAARITSHGYMSANADSAVSLDAADWCMNNLLRAKILLKEIDLLKGNNPHIVDLGPGEYWVPLGLSKRGYDFTYKPISLDVKAAATAKDLMRNVNYQDLPAEGQPIVFVAHEVIEHLPHTADLAIEALRFCKRWPDYVHLSTPLYTYDMGVRPWNHMYGLPHLRAYTPREFIAEAQSIFPGYNWEYESDVIQSLRGYKIGGAILTGAK
jgi:hypothetical protein